MNVYKCRYCAFLAEFFKMNKQWQFIICPYNSTQQSSSWAANNHSASQEIPHIIWKPKAHYCVHTSSQHFRIPAIWIQLTSFHFKSLRYILILSSYLHLDCQSGLITSAFWIHICHMASPSHPPWFGNPNISWWGAQIMNLIIMQLSTGANHEPHHYAIIYSLLLPPPSQVQIFSSLPYPPHTLIWYSSLIVTKFHTHLMIFFFFCLNIGSGFWYLLSGSPH
jgi:hypothetical protein